MSFLLVLSAGTAVSFGLDASLVSYMSENITWFVLATITWPILAFVVSNFVDDSNYFKEDSVFAPQYIVDSRHREERSAALGDKNIATVSVK
jgi:uncharacterized membrane protein